MSKLDFYEILEIDRTVSTEEVTRAYRRLAKLYHPDRNPGAEATAKFQAINKAYNALRDPEKREIYDEQGFVPDSIFKEYDSDIKGECIFAWVLIILIWIIISIIDYYINISVESVFSVIMGVYNIYKTKEIPNLKFYSVYFVLTLVVYYTIPFAIVSTLNSIVLFSLTSAMVHNNYPSYDMTISGFTIVLFFELFFRTHPQRFTFLGTFLIILILAKIQESFSEINFSLKYSLKKAWKYVWNPFPLPIVLIIVIVSTVIDAISSYLLRSYFAPALYVFVIPILYLVYSFAVDWKTHAVIALILGMFAEFLLPLRYIVKTNLISLWMIILSVIWVLQSAKDSNLKGKFYAYLIIFCIVFAFIVKKDYSHIKILHISVFSFIFLVPAMGFLIMGIITKIVGLENFHDFAYKTESENTDGGEI